MKKIVVLLCVGLVLVSCGPRRLGCGPYRRCEVKLPLQMSVEKNQTQVV